MSKHLAHVLLGRTVRDAAAILLEPQRESRVYRQRAVAMATAGGSG